MTRVYNDSFILRCPPSINTWLVLQFWYQYLCLVFSMVMYNTWFTMNVMYWYDSFTYIPVQLGLYLAWHSCCSVFRLCERRRLNQPPGVRLLRCSQPQRWGCGTALVGRRTGQYASHMRSCLCKVVDFRRYCNHPEREDMWSVIHMAIGWHDARNLSKSAQ